MRFSPSRLKTWGKCQQQAKFAYIDKIPQKQNAAASYGSAVHLALELYNLSGDMEAAIRTFLYAWDHPEEFGIKPDIWPPRTNFSSYRERGVAVLREYEEIHKWSERTFIASELNFCVKFRDHEFTGIVDSLEYDPKTDTVIIRDYKSGFRPNGDNLRMDIQFSIYMYASTQPEFWMGNDTNLERYKGVENGEELYEKYRDSERSGIWYDLRNNKEYNVGPRTIRDYDRLELLCNSVERAYEKEVFVPSISGDTCRICSYQDICPAYLSEEANVSI